MRKFWLRTEIVIYRDNENSSIVSSEDADSLQLFLIENKDPSIDEATAYANAQITEGHWLIKYIEIVIDEGDFGILYKFRSILSSEEGSVIFMARFTGPKYQIACEGSGNGNCRPA